MHRESITLFFFFQAEDGIRDYKVTGVQTCALPISLIWRGSTRRRSRSRQSSVSMHCSRSSARRSEEHTSELQSPCNLVCRLLLEKKKPATTTQSTASNRAAAAFTLCSTAVLGTSCL